MIETILFTSYLLISTIALFVYLLEPRIEQAEAVVVSFGGTLVFACWTIAMLKHQFSPNFSDETDSDLSESSSTQSEEEPAKQSESEDEQSQHDQEQQEQHDHDQERHDQEPRALRRSPRRFFRKPCQHCGNN